MIAERAPESESYGAPACRRQRRAWAPPLLVVALLYGLLAMHGLGTAASPAASHAHESEASVASHSTHPAHSMGSMHSMRSARPAQPATQAHPSEAVVPVDSADPAGEARTYGPHATPPLPEHQHADECECDGMNGHAAHADATCAASGTSGGPAMDGAAFAAATGPRYATGLEGCRPVTGGERAPPSLHRLQLLRI
ncbi:hypothetical protein HCC61_24875 [Streptomyces sp. HNM0575]|uniref:DUF6153 family protein n=1 Tax=Streptomyces sp. HNM0575 TaxID=2716338 RepID=UPI00145D07AF|nr:hypothetical protein [Streptomyces sp. HNM0575]